MTKGQVIKSIREATGMSLEELSFEICSPSTLSKIENDLQQVEWSRFERLIEKMGEDPRKYIFAMNKAEERAIQLEYDVAELLENGKYAKASELLVEMEDIKNLDDSSKQFITYARLHIDYSLERIDVQTATEGLEEILEPHLTRMAKNKGKLGNIFLTKNDIRFFIFLAYCYSKVDERKNISTLRQLKDYIFQRATDKAGFVLQYTAICANLSGSLGLAGDIEEALEIAEEGIKWCHRYESLSAYGQLLYNKACCLLLLDGATPEVKRLFQTVIHLLELRNTRESREMSRKAYEFAINNGLEL